MITMADVVSREFVFRHLTGGVIASDIKLDPGGVMGGYRHENEAFWDIVNGNLVFRSQTGEITTLFDRYNRVNDRLVFGGCFVPDGPELRHVLMEVGPRQGGIAQQLLAELYSGENPLQNANRNYRDQGYPHTNLKADLAASVLAVMQPKFWLEFGSMLGGSAIMAANEIKRAGLSTQIVCVDPFTGDVNMWEWERHLRALDQWSFLRLERGIPSIVDRFLANVVEAGHRDIILPVMATTIVGVKLIRNLFEQKRISSLPQVIYLDSAHETDETFLELTNCWNLLPEGGVLMGDDWEWDAVREDVLKFARTLTINAPQALRLAEHHGKFEFQDNVLLDRGQWVLVK